MARRAHFSDEDIAKARELRDKATNVMEFRKALSVLLPVEAGLDSDQTTEILGISESTLFRNRHNIRHQDKKQNTWGGRRHYSMTVKEEQDFLQPWEAKANEGGVLSVAPIHVALVERLGRAIPISNIPFAGPAWLAKSATRHQAS